MTRLVDEIKDPDLRGVEAALRRAALRARKISEQNNTPFIVYEDGRIVDLNAEGNETDTND